MNDPKSIDVEYDLACPYDFLSVSERIMCGKSRVGGCSHNRNRVWSGPFPISKLSVDISEVAACAKDRCVERYLPQRAYLWKKERLPSIS